MMRNILRILLVILPWRLRRLLLILFFKYELDSTSRIGFAWAFPNRLVMGPYSQIGHLTVCKGLDLLQLGEHASIGRLNWITGFPSDGTRHFVELSGRTPELRVGDHAAITHRHLIDCTDSIVIGEFSTVAGFRSQFLSHSVNLESARQDTGRISVGRYCFVGTDCVVLGGSVLPDFSVLGAKSLLNKSFEDAYRLYAGVPASAVKELPRTAAYFTRETGFVI
jgi:carbonic anhydrase/acetyltransferase-like protein (isoleucine patch superfamily)